MNGLVYVCGVSEAVRDVLLLLVLVVEVEWVTEELAELERVTKSERDAWRDSVIEVRGEWVLLGVALRDVDVVLVVVGVPRERLNDAVKDRATEAVRPVCVREAVRD